MSEKKTLTDKQKRFCEEYVVDWNATRAAKAAGYSENTADVIGSENLAKPYIAEYIEEIQKDLGKLAGISALGNLKTLKEIIEGNQDGEQIATHRDRMKAVEIINKMMGRNAPEQQEITVSKEPPLFPDTSNE